MLGVPLSTSPLYSIKEADFDVTQTHPTNIKHSSLGALSTALKDGERCWRWRQRSIRLPERNHRSSCHSQTQFGSCIQRYVQSIAHACIAYAHKFPGELQSVDGYMNIALEKTAEYVNGKMRRNYGDAFVRGNNGKGNHHFFNSLINYSYITSHVYFSRHLTKLRIHQLKHILPEIFQWRSWDCSCVCPDRFTVQRKLSSIILHSTVVIHCLENTLPHILLRLNWRKNKFGKRLTSSVSPRSTDKRLSV